MTANRTGLWILGLLLGCVAWGMAMSSALWGDYHFISVLGGGIGMGAPVFLVTGVGAGLVLAISRNRRTALQTWTGLIVVAIILLGIGTAREVHVLESSTRHTAR